MRVYVPISYTWDECYVINEIFNEYEYGDDEETYKFNIFQQIPFEEGWWYEEPTPKITIMNSKEMIKDIDWKNYK